MAEPVHAIATLLVCLIGLTACRTTRHPPAPPATTSAVDAYVVDEYGPVPTAAIRLIALPSGRCPCATEFDTRGASNEMPTCACPAALASWHTRLAACEWPSRAASTVPTDARGHATLQRSSGVTGIEVAQNGGVRWLPWPSHDGTISLELEASIAPRVTIEADPAAAIRGAVLFDDGHCVPLDRHGALWTPRVPLPRFETSGGVLVVEAPGYATILYSLFDQEHIELSLERDTPITGTCDGSTARLDNPYQHLVAKVDHDKQFSFTGAIDMSSKVSCWKDATTMTDEWTYEPGGELSDASYSIYGGGAGWCVDVLVVDAVNLPVAGADVAAMGEMGGFQSGTVSSTDTRGISCVDDLTADLELVVTPPGSLGGSCAGEVRVKLAPNLVAHPPIVVRLDVARLAHARPRGRVVSAEGMPVAGAVVGVGHIAPASTVGCNTIGDDQVITAADGTFQLPPQPRGKLTLSVRHDWYTDQDVEIVNDVAAHDIVLARGDRFIGRVLDPDGRPIESCSLFLTLASGRMLSGACSARGFSFGTITPGKANLQVRVEHHPLGTFRTLRKKLEFGAGKPHVEDVAFPRGEPISGRVVDTRGNAMPGARLTALPRGTAALSDRFHDDEVMLEADPDGRFTFRHLRPGTWSIRGDRRSGREITIDIATGTTDVSFVVPDPRAP